MQGIKNINSGQFTNTFQKGIRLSNIFRKHITKSIFYTKWDENLKKNVHFVLFFNHVQCTCIYINAIWSTHIPLSIKVYTPKSRKMLTLYEFQIIYLNLCQKSPKKIHFTFTSIILIQFHVVCRYLTVNNNPIYIRLCFWLVHVFSLHYPSFYNIDCRMQSYCWWLFASTYFL